VFQPPPPDAAAMAWLARHAAKARARSHAAPPSPPPLPASHARVASRRPRTR
jgi:hypothetical protein